MDHSFNKITGASIMDVVNAEWSNICRAICCDAQFKGDYVLEFQAMCCELLSVEATWYSACRWQEHYRSLSIRRNPAVEKCCYALVLFKSLNYLEWRCFAFSECFVLDSRRCGAGISLLLGEKRKGSARVLGVLADASEVARAEARDGDPEPER